MRGRKFHLARNPYHRHPSGSRTCAESSRITPALPHHLPTGILPPGYDKNQRIQSSRRDIVLDESLRIAILIKSSPVACHSKRKHQHCHHDRPPPVNLSGVPPEPNKPGNEKSSKYRRDSCQLLECGRRCATYQWKEIFCPALPHRTKASVHPCPNDSCRSREINPALRRFHAAGQSYILENLGANRLVTAQLLVNVPSHQNKLSVRGGIQKSRIVHTLKRESRRQPAIHKWDQNSLPPRLHLLLRRIRDQRRIVLSCICQRSSHRPRQMEGIGVCEQQPIALRRSRAHPRGVILPHPSARQRSCRNYL